jgi:hypothetical protein
LNKEYSIEINDNSLDDWYPEFKDSMKEFVSNLKESLKEMMDDLKDDLSGLREEIEDMVQSGFESVRGRDSYDHY